MKVLSSGMRDVKGVVLTFTCKLLKGFSCVESPGIAS
jgi:hypothetical protein